MNRISENAYYIVALDSETTGLDASEQKVAEIAFRIIEINSGKELASYESLIKLSEEDWKKATPRALEVNGLTWEKISSGKNIQDVAKDIEQIFIKNIISGRNSVFLCQNPSFDRPFFNQILSPAKQSELRLPYLWLDLASMDAALRWRQDFENGQEHKIVSLSKDNIANRLNLPPEAQPHKAMNGVDHLLKIFERIVGYPKNEMAPSPSKIVKFELPAEQENKRKRDRQSI